MEPVLAPDNVIAGHTVCITGAGGFIGSELAHASAAAGARSVILIESVEQRLIDIETALRHRFPHLAVHSLLGSVTDQPLLQSAFDSPPHLVLHAAAYKHVPLLEHHPFAALEINAAGTLSLASAAAQSGVSSLVVISTDKAVRPHSIMGASKRIAELIASALSTPGCTMTSIRLVNVLGSTGSVVPIFRRQLAQGQPLTVTDAQATRYFISASQAVSAILAAAASPHHGTVHLPHTNAPVNIAALACRLRQEHGSNAPILFTGLQPGEKLHEELTYPNEHACGTVAGILHSYRSPAPEWPVLLRALDSLRHAIRQRDLPEAIATLSQLVPEYQPSAAVLSQLAPVEAG